MSNYDYSLRTVLFPVSREVYDFVRMLHHCPRPYVEYDNCPLVFIFLIYYTPIQHTKYNLNIADCKQKTHAGPLPKIISTSGIEPPNHLEYSPTELKAKNIVPSVLFLVGKL